MLPLNLTTDLENKLQLNPSLKILKNMNLIIIHVLINNEKEAELKESWDDFLLI